MKLNQVATEFGPRIRQKEFAQAVDVVPRTIRNWRKRTSPDDFPKLGRPAHDERAHRNAFWRVGREDLRQGRCGWRGVSAALRGQVPDRLIQRYVRVLKTCQRRHERRRILRRQVRVEVLAKNTLWVQDSAQVGRERAGGRKIESQIIKDRGTLVTVGVSTGDPTRTQDVIELLEKLKKVRGLPLVLGSDNGSPFVSEETEAYLKRERVIHLRSLPRTPQHNGSAEIGIGEIKRCTQLRKDSRVERAIAHATVVLAAQLLNKNRIRLSKGLKTGAELDEILPVGYHQVKRDWFYRECSRSMEEAQQRSSGKRERRMAEREAIYSTMEKVGLVRRTRGGSQATTKAEIFS